MNKTMHMTHYVDANAVAEAVADAVLQAATTAIAQRGVFHWALAGGTTPRLCYEKLRYSSLDWANTHIWFGDERCLPLGDQERNEEMAERALLSHISIPQEQVHRMCTERGAEEAAKDYHTQISSIACLDLVLLGMGEDGHTASLFPNNPALRDKSLAVAVFDAPKAPSDRVSLGYTALNAARQRIVMVTGAAKGDTYQQICRGDIFPVCLDNSAWYVSI